MAHYLRNKKRNGFRLGTCKDLSFLFWIAQEKGFIADEKIQIDYKVASYTRKSMEQMLAGEVDCAILVETNVSYLGYIQPKIPVKCIASLEKRLCDGMLMRCENSREAVPADLKGKTIAFMPRTTSHSFLMRFLEKYNIDRQDIKLKVMTPQVMPDALVRGDVEAISCWHPYLHNAIFAMKELGIPYTYFQNTGFYASEVALVVPKPFLIRNEHLLRRFLRALKQAEDYMQQNRAEVLPLLIQVMKLAGQSHEDVWRRYDSRLTPLGENYLGNIEMLGEWIREKDTEFQGRPLPDYIDLIDNGLILDILTEKRV